VRAGRAAGQVSRRLGVGQGGIIGGRVAVALDRGVLGRLAAGRQTVLVTGTNGKTTTAHMVAAAVRTLGPVAHNDTGANMDDGAAAALMSRPEARLAVLEVDELHLPRVAAAVSPAVMVLLNLSRDQLDRGAEVTMVAAAIRRAVLENPRALVVANCDDPVVVNAAWGVERVEWVAAGASWVGDATLCPQCGKRLDREGAFWSSACGFARPEPTWDLQDDVVVGPGSRTPLTLQLPGQFNVGNAITAMAAAAALGVPADDAAAAIGEIRSVAQRYAVIEHGRHAVHLLLAKNPAGWQATLPLLQNGRPILFVVNARAADSTDTSWLWDVPFEELDPRPTVACGEHAADIGLRLSYAGIDHETMADPLAALATLPAGDVSVVANYTAFLGFWRQLLRAGQR
jgi:UDP-N-acetylmuramyl tripeptide synthase